VAPLARAFEIFSLGTLAARLHLVFTYVSCAILSCRLLLYNTDIDNCAWMYPALPTTRTESQCGPSRLHVSNQCDPLPHARPSRPSFMAATPSDLVIHHRSPLPHRLAPSRCCASSRRHAEPAVDMVLQPSRSLSVLSSVIVRSPRQVCR